MKVKDMMSKGVVTVDENLSIHEVAGVMARYDISGVAVVGKEGSLEGTISQLDIVEAIAEEKNMDRLRAGDIMMPCTITVDPETSMEEVSEIMHKENVHRLFVCVEEEIKPAKIGPKYRLRPTGVITAGDLVKYLARG